MASLVYPIQRFSELARTSGPRVAVTRAWHRARADVWLAARQARWWMLDRPLPAARTILQHTNQPCSSLTEFLAHLAGKESPAYLFSSTDKAPLVNLWHKNYPVEAALIVKEADDICMCKFDLLGTQYCFSRADDIAWHYDAATQQHWPLWFVDQIDRWFWPDQTYGDYRPLWELNRHQYFITLGKAYWLTGDEKYAETCAAHMLSWIHANPCGFGLNWYSALEIGLRLIAWTLAFHFFRSSSHFIQLAGPTFLQSLYQQATYLRQHLTLNWAVRNNHIIGEAAALTYVGAVFDEFVEAQEWRDTGLCILQAELLEQTYPEGVNREQAPAYHRFVLDFLLLLIALSRRGALPPLLQMETLVEKMLVYVMCVMTPAYDLPLLGDADDARGVCLSRQDNRTREALAVGAVLFQRPDFKHMAQHFEEGAFWLLGAAGLNAFQALTGEPPPLPSRSFTQAGQYILRSGWTPESDYALFRCGEFGLGGESHCAHAHCDLLSPIVWVRGQSLLIDPGTYSYRGPWRDRLRSTRAHNSIMIDGEEQAQAAGPFSWRHVPHARCEAWETERVVGSLNSRGVAIQRELTHPRLGAWRIVDRINGIGTHAIEWAFHFAPQVKLLAACHNPIELGSNNDPHWHALCCLPDVDVTVEDDRLSAQYGVWSHGATLRARWKGDVTAGVSFTWLFTAEASGDSETAKETPCASACLA
jgi:hypothetical protein